MVRACCRSPLRASRPQLRAPEQSPPKARSRLSRRRVSEQLASRQKVRRRMRRVLKRLPSGDRARGWQPAALPAWPRAAPAVWGAASRPRAVRQVASLRSGGSWSRQASARWAAQPCWQRVPPEAPSKGPAHGDGKSMAARAFRRRLHGRNGQIPRFPRRADRQKKAATVLTMSPVSAASKNGSVTKAALHGKPMKAWPMRDR